MPTHTIVLDWLKPPVTANEREKMHRQSWAKQKKQIATCIYVEAVKQLPHPKELDFNPCNVEIIWYVKDLRKRDCDNMHPLMKAALDALKGRWLVDEDWQHVPSITQTIRLDRERPRIEIRLTEVAPEVVA